MAKYSQAFKLMIVQEYLKGNGGYQYLADKYGIPDKTQVRRWVSSYKTLGEDGLKRFMW